MLSTIPRHWQEPGIEDSRAQAELIATLLEEIDVDQTSIRDSVEWLLRDSVQLAKHQGMDRERAIADAIAWLNVAVAQIACHQIDALR